LQKIKEVAKLLERQYAKIIGSVTHFKGRGRGAHSCLSAPSEIFFCLRPCSTYNNISFKSEKLFCRWMDGR